MMLLPLAIDPIGCLGPLFRLLLYNSHPLEHLRFPATRPNARAMYSRIISYPSPKGILTLADHNWKHNNPTGRFFGNSYTSPTPTIFTLQTLGLCFIKAFAAHIRHATRVISDHNLAPRAPNVPVLVPAYADHPR
jgi:hypothetical protein